MSKIASVKFKKSGTNEFYTELKQRVDRYFLANQLSYHAKQTLHFQIIGMFFFYFLLIGMIFSNQASGLTLIFIYSLLGFVTSLICTNFCHDVIHGAYFKSLTLSRLFGYIYDLNGLSSYMWKLSHNVRHHTFTNIPGHDEDIDKGILLRLSPKDPVYPFQRFQHFYAFFLYCFTSLNWGYYSDIKGFIEELRYGNIPKQEKIAFVVLKCANLLLFLFLPMLLLSAPWWQVAIGFVSMHIVGGFVSAIVFQLAHVVENVSFPEPDDEGYIPQRWALHEMQTTSNFATNSPYIGWVVGGLNYQVEHHLFPYICHVHYPEINKIVKQTASDFSVPYHEQPTFAEAIKSHFRMLRKLGKGEFKA